ncbi:MAG: hypothetical protein ACE5I5_20190 [Candidatus Heimdallarchaeota archaeon]
MIATYVSGPVSAAVDFVAYKAITTISDAEIDGTIGTEWDDAGHLTGVAIDPQGTAEVWTKHDETSLYIAINFTADSNDPWVGIQLGGTDCMDADIDLALFGDNNYAADGYKDMYFTAGYGVAEDTVQDGVGAITAVGNVITIELKKPLNSGDEKDNAWSVGDTYKLIIDWDSDGGGNSGDGSANHRAGGPIVNNIYINPDEIPEFPGLMLVVVLIAVLIPVILFTRKMRPRVSASRKL